MTYPVILFAPLVALLPVSASVDLAPAVVSAPVAARTDGSGAGGPASARLGAPQARKPADSFREQTPFREVAERLREASANQVRIEQRITIRVSPRQPAQPNMLMALPGREIGPRFLERKIGKCLKISRIAGVQPNGGNELLLFMNDRRIVNARLERSCRSRDFYSGFYLSQTEDGRLCVDRDTLLSRSGANCKLTRMRQLIEAED